MLLNYYSVPADLLKYCLVGESIVSDREVCLSLITKYCILLSPCNKMCFIQSTANETLNAVND